MRQIDLQEGQRSVPHALTRDQRDALREIKSLIVDRADITTRMPCYYPTPGSDVGAVEVDGLSVRIEPKIGVPQLLSLACYAVDRVKLHPRDFDFHRAAALPDYLVVQRFCIDG